MRDDRAVLGVRGGTPSGSAVRAPIAINPASLEDSMALHSVLVAYDGSKPAVMAASQAVDIAKLSGAKLTLVCVIPVMAAAYGIEMPPGGSVAETIEGARRMLVEAKADLVKKGVEDVETVLMEGDPVDRVLEYAEKHPPDLIVAGSRGLSDAGRFFLGSVSDGILHHARCSVLVVKSGTPFGSPRASHAM
jgi:nucleotide-binding universal stress UspA family protein